MMRRLCATWVRSHEGNWSQRSGYWSHRHVDVGGNHTRGCVQSVRLC